MGKPLPHTQRVYCGARPCGRTVPHPARTKKMRGWRDQKLTTRTWFQGAASAGALLISATAAAAQAQNDPQTGGPLNREWGAVASRLAKESDDSVTGGGMGAHSRSTRAADINGGFANSDNGFGITLNSRDGDGNAGRDGVGNVSRGSVHNAHPGDGGNGQHALNNADAAGRLDPVTGELVGAGGEARDLTD
jgi:hypothetical protein